MAPSARARLVSVAMAVALVVGLIAAAGSPIGESAVSGQPFWTHAGTPARAEPASDDVRTGSGWRSGLAAILGGQRTRTPALSAAFTNTRHGHGTSQQGNPGTTADPPTITPGVTPQTPGSIAGSGSPVPVPAPSTTAAGGSSTTEAPTTQAPSTTAAPTTTAAPKPTTTLAPLIGGGPRPFSSASLWNTPVSSTGANAGLTQGWVNQSKWTPSVYHGNDSMPTVPVTVPASWGWPAATLNLPIPAGAHPTSDTDAEMVIVDDTTGVVTDLYGVTVGSGSYSASAWAQSNLAATGFGTASPFQAAGIRAIGCSSLGGLITGSDLSSGVINHGLAIALPYNLLSGNTMAPAIAGDAGGGPGSLEEGERLAIPAGTPKPAGLSPVGSMVWDALTHYGVIIVDQDGGAAALYMDAVSTTSGQGSQLQGDVNTILSALARVN